MLGQLPFIPWNKEEMGDVSPNKRERQRNKKDQSKPQLHNEKFEHSSFHQPAIHSTGEEFSIQNYLVNGSSSELEREKKKKSQELQQQLHLLAGLLRQKTEEIDGMNRTEGLLEDQLKVLTLALEDKKLQLQQQLIANRNRLTQIEEDEQLTEDEKWELDQLIDLSIQSKDHSYSPYSKFRVGCILKTQTGEFYKGCNVENASYGLAICAERTAIVKAVSEGHREFSTIVISSDLSSNFIAPCGACRQFMSEFGNFDVYLTKPDKSYKKFTVADLLPESFTPKDLNISNKGKIKQ